MNEFRFNSIGHSYELLVDGKWKKLTGITSILKVIAKPALIQWAANMAVDYVKNNWGLEDVPALKKEEWDKMLEEAKLAHRKKKEEAGQKGTDVHAIIEQEIKEAIEKNNGLISEFRFNRENLPQVKHFINWAVNNKVKFLESEKRMYSKELFLGGTMDFACEIDGDLWFGDIKTGSGIYAEAFWQMAGYQILAEEMGVFLKEIKGHIVLNLKKTGEFEEKRSVSNDDNKKAFLAALTIYRVKEKIEGQILSNNKRTITFKSK